MSKILASDRASSDSFGYAVAVSGNTMVVGARYADPLGRADAGAAYVFVRSGASWNFQQKLIAADLTAGDNFGWSVAIDADRRDLIVVGAPGRASRRGSAFVFRRCGGETGTYAQEAQLNATPDPGASANFGYSVGVWGDAAIVSAPYAAGTAGRAYIFGRSFSPNCTDAHTWSQVRAIDDGVPDGTPQYFGWSVAMWGGRVAVGAIGNQAGRAGSASVFINGGSFREARLTASDATSPDYFGFSVAFDAILGSNTLVVGSPYDTNAGGSLAGAAYVYTNNNNTWSQQAKLLATDASADDQLGWSVAMYGCQIVAGALGDDIAGFNSAGSAYVFERNGSTWSQSNKLLPGDPGTLNYFGAAVGIGSGGIGVGAWRNTTSGTTEAGAAYASSCQATPTVTAIADATLSVGCSYFGGLCCGLGGYCVCASVTEQACANPVTWSLISGPAGMTIGAANGTVSWPTIGPAGTYLVTIRATNSTGSDDESWVLTVIGGDVNCDGQANGDDIAAFNACFLLGPAIAPGCSGADLDGDGDVDAQDLSLFVALLLAP